MPLRAVIFDYGKVISLPADLKDHDEMVSLSGLDELTFERHYWELRDRYDGGFLSCEEYFREIVARGGSAPLSEATLAAMVEADCRMWTHINEPMVDWVLAVKRAGYKLGILSNLGDALVRHMLAHFEWLAAFDHLTWSSEHRLYKPQPEIYLLTLKALGVEPCEAIFIDDKAENIAAAKACGMEGILFTDLASLPALLAGHVLLATLQQINSSH